MKVSQKTWTDYVGNLRDLNDTATGKVRQYLETHEIQTNQDRNQLVSYAFAVSTKYGEGAAALSAKMFDSIAAAEGVSIPEAEVADTATMDETARAVVGTLKTGNNDIVAGSVGRLVKMAGVDTTMKNAIRYGAEWAWIPQGNETCAFCLMLASRGWQPASKNALKHGHAEHIHAHCDCLYAVRFDSSTEYEGYDPDKYLKMYEDAEGDTWQEKLNSMRRDIYSDTKRKSVKNSSENDMINYIRKTLIPKQHTDRITVRQEIHRQGTKLFNERQAKLAEKGEYGPSYVTISDDDILKLVDKYKGTGIISCNKAGEWDRREVITQNDRIIGYAVNNLNGITVETSVFKIHYGNDGVHIVPDYPSKKGGGRG